MFIRAPIDLLSPNPDHDPIRTVAELADFACDNNPDHLFCYQAEKKFSSDPTLRPVTLRQLKQAVLRCQHSLKDLVNLADVQHDTSHPKPVALFMDSDLSLAIYTLSLIALGVPVSILFRLPDTTQNLTNAYARFYSCLHD